MKDPVLHVYHPDRVEQIQRKNEAPERSDLGKVAGLPPERRLRLRPVQRTEQFCAHREQGLPRREMLIRQDQDSTTSHFSKRYASTATPAAFLVKPRSSPEENWTRLSNRPSPANPSFLSLWLFLTI